MTALSLGRCSDNHLREHMEAQRQQPARFDTDSHRRNRSEYPKHHADLRQEMP